MLNFFKVRLSVANSEKLMNRGGCSDKRITYFKVKVGKNHKQKDNFNKLFNNSSSR